MRIIHCAPFNILTKSGGALYANPIKISQGLIQNNHFVHNFDYRDSARYYSFFKNKKNGAKKMNQFFKDLINDLNPDLIVFGHAELIFEETLEYIRSKRIKTIFWYNDIVFDKHFHSRLHLYDMVLITAGGKMLNQLKEYNENCFFLPNLVDDSIERYKGFENNAPIYDIFFPARKITTKGALREELIDIINKNFPTLNKKFIGQTKESVIIGDDYFKLMNDSKISINHNRDFSMEEKYEWYTSDRLMHFMGNGAFTISTQIVDGERFFEDKLDYYKSFDELCEKIDFYFENKKLRVDNAKWLYKRTHELFNSKRVSAYILDLLKEDEKKLIHYEWFK